MKGIEVKEEREAAGVEASWDLFFEVGVVHLVVVENMGDVDRSLFGEVVGS